MAEFRLKLPEKIHEQIRELARDENRSQNGQIVTLLLEALKARKAVRS